MKWGIFLLCLLASSQAQYARFYPLLHKVSNEAAKDLNPDMESPRLIRSNLFDNENDDTENVAVSKELYKIKPPKGTRGSGLEMMLRSRRELVDKRRLMKDLLLRSRRGDDSLNQAIMNGDTDKIKIPIGDGKKATYTQLLASFALRN